jgi:hypothetical protein
MIQMQLSLALHISLFVPVGHENGWLARRAARLRLRVVKRKLLQRLLVRREPERLVAC